MFETMLKSQQALMNKDYESTIKYLNILIDYDPNFLSNYSLRAKCYKELGKYDYAVRDYSKFINSKNQENEIISPIEINCLISDLNDRGNAYSLMGNYELAIKDYNNIFSIKNNLSYNFEDTIWAYYNRGVVFEKTKRFDEAIKDFELFLKHKPYEEKVLLSIGQCYIKKVNLIDENNFILKGMEYYDYVLANINQYSGEAYYLRGAANGMLSNHETALEDFQNAEELGLAIADLFYNKGISYYRLEEFDLAIEEFNKTLSINPSHNNAKSLLAKLMSENY